MLEAPMTPVTGQGERVGGRAGPVEIAACPRHPLPLRLSREPQPRHPARPRLRRRDAARLPLQAPRRQRGAVRRHPPPAGQRGLAVPLEVVRGRHGDRAVRLAAARRGAAAGTLFGVSDVAIKALTGLGGVAEVIVSPWLAVALLGSVIAFYASARGMQDGEAVPVIASTSTAANVSCILGGIVVFGDPMPTDTLGIILQAVAFSLVVVAALVTPPPLRAAEANAAPA